MRDPVEKMRKFVEEQKQRSRLEHARRAWGQKVPELLPCAEAVVEALRAGLAPDQEPLGAVSVLADTSRDGSPLVIAFERRSYSDSEPYRLQPERAHGEVGASAVFRVEPDGQVCGWRYPFHSVMMVPEPELFAELGDPAGIQAEELGNAVVEFLQWAAVGTGSGSRTLRFWAPVALADTPRVRLAVVAA